MRGKSVKYAGYTGIRPGLTASLAIGEHVERLTRHQP